MFKFLESQLNSVEQRVKCPSLYSQVGLPHGVLFFNEEFIKITLNVRGTKHYIIFNKYNVIFLISSNQVY